MDKLFGKDITYIDVLFDVPVIKNEIDKIIPKYNEISNIALKYRNGNEENRKPTEKESEKLIMIRNLLFKEERVPLPAEKRKGLKAPSKGKEKYLRTEETRPLTQADIDDVQDFLDFLREEDNSESTWSIDREFYKMLEILRLVDKIFKDN